MPDEDVYEALTEDALVDEIKSAVGNLRDLDEDIKRIYAENDH